MTDQPAVPDSTDTVLLTHWYTGEPCPRCADDGGVGALYTDGETVWCERCGYMRDEWDGSGLA